jgi:predicted amidophosphoribosyltransferase
MNPLAASNSDTLEVLLPMVAIAALIWTAYFLLIHRSCPVCGRRIKRSLLRCPKCGESLYRNVTG